MKVNEIKRTIEEVVRVEYVAEDGTVFRDKAECEKYEESALFVASKKLKRLGISTNYYLTEYGDEEDDVEIFDVQNEEDLDNLKKYLYLGLSVYSDYNEEYINKNYSFDNLTYGHEIVVFWSYEKEYGFDVYGDGSFDDYLEYLREKFNKLCPVEEN